MSEWISVSEKLPEKLDEYIVMIKGAKVPTALWYNPNGELWKTEELGIKYPVTHWMPLPEPPKEEAV